MQSTQQHITGLTVVMFSVTDQDEAVAFYEKLGFEKRTDTPFGNGDRWVEVAHPGAATAIALVIPPDDRPVEHGVVGLSTDDADAAHAALREQGIEVGDIMRMGPPVPTMFHAPDPYGNSLWIVESM
jgi:catechol 2,3-dioxygenase-like lactoylglutathione lyase family enzyme